MHTLRYSTLPPEEADDFWAGFRAPGTTTPADPPAAGWLLKKGSGRGLFGRRTWKRRFVELAHSTDVGPVLEYYAMAPGNGGRGSRRKMGQVVLDGCRVVPRE